jgi:PEGA domain
MGERMTTDVESQKFVPMQFSSTRKRVHFSRALTAISLCCLLPTTTLAAESQVGYDVTYSGGSLPNVKGGEGLKLYLDATRIRLRHNSQDVVVIPARAITEVSYGEEVHHRIGTAAGLAVVSLGIGALVAFSKSKKHYIGVTWADSDNKGGIVLQADKNEYRGLLTALEGVSGKTAIDTDSPKQPVQQPASARAVAAPATPAETSQELPAAVAQPQAVLQTHAIPQPPVGAPLQGAPPALLEGTIVRFLSTPTNAEVQVDGEYWGNTPTADLTRLPVGPHTILVKKVGYQAWERKITLAPGDNRTISAELEVQPRDPTKPHIAGN